MPKQVVGRFTKVVVAQMDPNEDLLAAIKTIARDQDIETGVILSITGALSHVRLQHFPDKPPADAVVEVLEIPGPVECSGTGVIGRVIAPQYGTKPFGVGQYVHGDPYVHVHLTVTALHETICGHLMPGCTVWSPHPTSHFTIMVAGVEDASLQLRLDAEREKGGKGMGVYHHVAQK